MDRDNKERGQSPGLDRSFLVTAFIAATLMASHVIGLMSTRGHSVRFISDLATLFASAVASVTMLRAGRRQTGRMRRAWWLLSAAVGFWAVGEAIWSYYELVAGREVPFPSLADAGFLAMIPLAAAGLLSFPTRRQDSSTRLRTFVDGCNIASAVFCISAVTVLPLVIVGGSASKLALSIGIAYPLGDVVLASIVVFMAVRSGRDRRIPLGLLGSGLVALAVADSGFVYLTSKDLYSSGNPIDLAWTAGFLLIALAGAKRPRRPRSLKTDNNDPGIFLPYFAAFVGLSVFVLRLLFHSPVRGLVGWSLAFIGVFVMWRTLLTFLDTLTLRRTLETKVAERTQQLEGALRELSEADRLQDEFISNTSHELRTPLTVMVGVIRTVNRKDFGLRAEGHELLDMAERNAKKMERLVEDLLMVSSIESEAQIMIGSLDLGEVISSHVGASPAYRSVAISVEEGLSALGDRETVCTILDHLLSNSLKFSPDDSKVAVTARRTPRGAEIVVRDWGHGIPKERREQALRRFSQLDGGNTREHGGVGLGLYLSKRLAESMGGWLEIDDVDEGTSIRVVLAVSEKPAAEQAMPGSAPSSENLSVKRS